MTPVVVALPYAAPIGVYAWWIEGDLQLAYRVSYWMGNKQWCDLPVAGRSDLLFWARLIETGEPRLDVVWEMAVAEAGNAWAMRQSALRVNNPAADSLQLLAAYLADAHASGDYQCTIAAALVHLCQFGVPTGPTT